MIKFLNKPKSMELCRANQYTYHNGKDTEIGRRMTVLECIGKLNLKKTGIFAAGVLFGTAGIKVLSSKDAKKVYTNCTAAVLRAKDSVMKTAAVVQENAEDIYAQAKQINEERAAQEEAVLDEAEGNQEVSD